MTVAGTSTLNGTIFVSPRLLGASLAPGTYTVLTYANTLLGSPVFSWSDSTGSGLLASFSTATANQVRVTLTTPLQSWRSGYFGTTAATGTAANDADPDADGVINLLEYALGTNPTSAASVTLPVSQLSALNSQPFLSLTFPRVADPLLTYTVQGSSDLVTWTDLWTSTGPANTAGPVTVTDPQSVSPRRFLRLQISTPLP